MIIFSITLFPLSLIFVNSILSPGRCGRHCFKDGVLKGVISFIPAFFILLIFDGLIKTTNTYSNIFFYHLIYDFALYYIIIYFGYNFFYKNSVVYKFREKVSEIFIYECGFYAALAVYDMLYMYRWENPYILFILPGARLLQAVLFSFSLSSIGDSAGYKRYFAVFFMISIPFIVSLIPFFFYINSFLYLGLVFTVLIVLSVWLYYHFTPFQRIRGV